MKQFYFSHRFPEMELRALAERDLPALHTILSIPAVGRAYFGTFPGHSMVAEYLSALLAFSHENSNAIWVIADMSGDQSAHGLVNFRDGRLSYLLTPQYWRQGIMYHALKDLLALHEGPLTAAVYRGNTASVQLLEKLCARFAGLTFEESDYAGLREAMLNFRLEAGR